MLATEFAMIILFFIFAIVGPFVALLVFVVARFAYGFAWSLVAYYAVIGITFFTLLQISA